MKSLLLATVATIGLALPANAAVTFRFNQLTSTPPGGTIAHGELTISDSAFANGISFIRSSDEAVGISLDGTGILSINFSAGVTGAFKPSPTYEDFRSYDVDDHTFWLVDLSSNPSHIPTGTIFWAQESHSFQFNLNNSPSDGQADTDEPNMFCSQTGDCRFEGSWEMVVPMVSLVASAPEPASIALLMLGLLGLGIVRRISR